MANKALQAVNEESIKVRSAIKKKINSAQAELTSLKDTLANQQRALELAEGKVSGSNYYVHK